MNRIQLRNHAFEGLNDVYVLDGERTTLVDTAIDHAPVRDELVEGLAGFGLTFADVDEILVTHWHSDHAGLVGEIQRESGATVHVHEADAPLVAQDDHAVTAIRERQREAFEAWGMPDDPRERLETFFETHDSYRGAPADVTPLRDGDTLTVGDREVEVVHLPGHAAGLAAFAFDGEQGREAFVGDAVLPKYTPNVGGADVRVDRPLERYVESLLRFVDCEFDRVWPGHRDPIDAPSDRALTILDHHRDRTQRVVDVLDEHGPCDTWTVSAHLFGDLDGVHILHGPGEAYAHLDHLAAHGVVERDGLAYALTTTDPDVSALFPKTKH